MILPFEIYTGLVDGAQGGITLHDGTPAVNDIVLDVKWGLGGEELTNAGGTVSLNVPWIAFYHCALPDCSSRSQSSTSPDYINYISGTLTTVPIPAAAWLFGSGLLGLIGVARSSNIPLLQFIRPPISYHSPLAILCIPYNQGKLTQHTSNTWVNGYAALDGRVHAPPGNPLSGLVQL